MRDIYYGHELAPTKVTYKVAYSLIRRVRRGLEPKPYCFYEAVDSKLAEMFPHLQEKAALIAPWIGIGHQRAMEAAEMIMASKIKDRGAYYTTSTGSVNIWAPDFLACNTNQEFRVTAMANCLK